ncbi:MAG: hypothetical protein OEY86_09940 [Nitrospira sp.]|nr:hypothetical protein [Nitrospira sp.]
MNRTAQAALFAGLVLIMSAGCKTGTILDIRDAGVPATIGQNLAMDDVAQGIISAGSKLNWTMAVQTQGHIVGTLAIRRHTAVIDIFYSTNSYSILYKDSSNLKYDANRKTIHPNYTSWIRNLHAAIQKELGGAGKPD